jgi:hypothetical protein
VRAFCLCKLSIGFDVPFWRLCLCPAKSRFPTAETSVSGDSVRIPSQREERPSIACCLDHSTGKSVGRAIRCHIGPEFAQSIDSRIRRIARDDGRVDRPDRDPGDPIEMNACLGEGLVDTGLVGAESTAAASNDQEHSSRFVCGKRRIGRQAKGSSNRGPAPMARANYRASGR